MRKLILAFVDFFYKPFNKIIPKTDFRYLAIGGSTWLLGNLIYAIAYEFVFKTPKLTKLLGASGSIISSNKGVFFCRVLIL